MNAKDLVGLVMEVERHHDRKYNPSSIELIWPDIIDLHEEALPIAATRLKTEFNTLPAPARLQEILQQESKKFDAAKETQRVAAWEKKKAEENKRGAELFRESVGEEYEADARHYLRVLFFGKSTPREKYEAALAMTEKYPAIHDPEEAEKFFHQMVAAEAAAEERQREYANMRQEVLNA